MAQHCVQHLQTDEIDYYGLNIKYTYNMNDRNRRCWHIVIHTDHRLLYSQQVSQLSLHSISYTFPLFFISSFL